MNYSLVITFVQGEYSIEYIHWFEKQMDAALIPMGYSRVGTEKSDDKIEFRYYQFAVAL
jgi:hypothetical protein